MVKRKRLDNLIEQIVDDPNYRIFKSGKILTKMSKTGNLSKNNPWREATYHGINRKQKINLNICYKQKNILVSRIIYKKFIGVLKKDQVISHKDKNYHNNHYKNLEQREKPRTRIYKGQSKNYWKYIHYVRKEAVNNINKIINEKRAVWHNSEKYSGIDFFCEITCSQGHDFQMLGRSIFKRGSWCLECLKNKNTGEFLCRVTLEELFNVTFPKIRIKEMKSPVSKFSLEIDGFNKDNNIGFEYQGNQHYEYNPFFHKTKKSFKELKIRDKYKRKFFKDKQWTLLVIKGITVYDIEKFVKRLIVQLKEQGFEFEETNVNINKIQEKLNNFTKSYEPYREECLKYIENSGYKYILGIFTGKRKNITLEKEGLILKYTVATLLKKKCLSRFKARTLKKSIRSKKWSVEDAIKESKNFKTLKEFREKHPALLHWCYVNGSYKIVTANLTRKQRSASKKKFSDQQLVKIAKQHSSRKELIENNKSIYNLIVGRQLKEEAFSHMKKSIKIK